MRYLSLITGNCEKTARKHDLLKNIRKLSEKIEKDQSIESWDKFHPTPYIKKALGRSFRLICAYHPMPENDCIIISFLSCLPRGGNGDYDKFIDSPDEVCSKYLPDQQELKDFLESRQADMPAPPPPPDSFERDYLYDSLEQDDKSDTIFFESGDWVEALKTKEISDVNTRLFDTLGTLELSERGNFLLKNVGHTNLTVCYKCFPQYGSIFLFAAVARDDIDSQNDLKKKYRDIIAYTGDSEEMILKYSRRSYPQYILADETMWKSIQRDDVGNIALSPEESQILESVIKKADRKLYPLFINGRPGSGKSTILQYLFASYLFLFLKTEKEQRVPFPPIYLTYSEILLDTAKNNIDDILRCNAKFAVHDINLDSEENRRAKQLCYGIFHKFILNLLPEKERSLFSSEKKIEFPLFRRLWDEKRKKDPSKEIRKLTPELVWHVIRTYIKGMRYDPEMEFDEDAYRELPKSQQSVQAVTFANVYKHAWEGWYKPYCEEEYLWDDQDLVFAVLNNEKIDISRYPAIFCDEAQDFSKLELNLILRLSLYSNKTLSSPELKRIPFAFAGDPFQTLNPTGFDWGALQANFHEKIVSALDKSEIGSLEFNYQELSFNYRSSKFIVGLCNLIQLLRGILFNQPGLTPQRTWFDFESSMPVYFDVKDPTCEKKLREQSELVIILPCQEGEEEEYVAQDEFLSHLGGAEKEMRNFLSPMRAKGQEFSRVVIYKFGREYINNHPNLFKPLETSESHAKDKDLSLPLEYFMNRLYVGASRAKKRLIIVDDAEGIKALWGNPALKDIECLLKKYKNAAKNGWSSETINYIQEGKDDNWSEDRDNPELLAEEFHKAGLAEEDPYKLRLAESNYKRCEQPNQAQLCLAERYEIEGKLIAAGDIFLKLHKKEKALKCFWSAENYQKILETQDFSSTPEQRAASFYLGDKSYAECKQFLTYLSSQLTGTNQWKYHGDPQWKKLLDKCLESALGLPLDDKEHCKKLYALMEQLKRHNFSPSVSWKYAELAYNAEDYEQAIQYWNSKETAPNNIKYYTAMAYTERYPNNLKYLQLAEKYDEAVNEWEAHDRENLDQKTSSVVLNCLLKLNRFEDCIYLLEKYRNEADFNNTYMGIKKKSPKDLEKIGKMYLNYLVSLGEWRKAISLTDDNSLNTKTKNTFIIILTYHLASSKDLRQSSLDNLERASRFLKKTFIDRRWEAMIPIRVVGAAIENANRIIYALEFYEGIWKRKRIPADERDINYATQRWVRCKLKLAEHSENDGHRENATKHRNEAEKICESHLNAINKDGIPDEPQFEAGENIINQEITKSYVANIDKDKKEIINALHEAGWTPAKIADKMKLDEDIVKIIFEIC